MASWVDKVRGLFSRAAPAGSLTKAQFEGGLLSPGAAGRGPPARGTQELIRSYRDQPWLRAVTSRIARGVASARFSIYVRAEQPLKSGRMAPPWRWGADRAVRDFALQSHDRKARAARREALQREGLLREVTDHPMLKLLSRPNDTMTGQAALQLTQVWLDIKGEAFWLISFAAADGTPAALFPVPPHWVTSVPTTGANHFTVSVGGLQLKVEPKSVLWFRDLDPENPYGRGSGVAEALGDELETDEYAAKYIKTWFFNNATPSLIVSFEGATKPQLQEAMDAWEQKHRGTHNAHRTHFAGAKMNAVKLDTAFKDQQLVELRAAMRNTVIQVFGVPPECIGVIEDSNRATIDAADYMMTKGVEYPRVEFLRGELAHQLLPRYPGGDAAVLEAELTLPDDPGRRLEVMRSQATAFTLNEWRAEAGHEPLKELDGQFPAAMPGQAEPGKLAEGEKTEDEEGQTELEPAEAERADPPWAKHLQR